MLFAVLDTIFFIFSSYLFLKYIMKKFCIVSVLESLKIKNIKKKIVAFQKKKSQVPHFRPVYLALDE